MITEAIILAGGLGTRLRNAVPDLPKCMAAVAGKPFIDYVLQYLSSAGITHFILALGYQSQVIQQHVKKQYADRNIAFSIEEEPLGTGGAIAKACTQVKGDYAIVTNGDTLYKVDLQPALPMLENGHAECVLFVKPMQNADRYGAVELGKNGLITAFREKKFFAKSLINGGLYAVNISTILQQPFPAKFSFEKDYLETKVTDKVLYGIRDDSYFIDIGIPEDFKKQIESLQVNKYLPVSIE